MKKKVIQIETLTDIQLSVGNGVQTDEDDNGLLSEKECIFLLAQGYDPKQDKEVEVPIFLSLEESEKLRLVLFELLPHKPPFA